MTLFEIVTTECYVRAYAWAFTEDEARKMFVERHGDKYGIRTVRALFSSASEPFVTDVSDSGL